MRKGIGVVLTAVALISFVIAAEFGTISAAYAVDPPKYGERQKAEAYRKKGIKQQIAEDKASGCRYGKDKKTGKCYEPREGQFYRDPQTGEVKVKKIEKINVPWK